MKINIKKSTIKKVEKHLDKIYITPENETFTTEVYISDTYIFMKTDKGYRFFKKAYGDTGNIYGCMAGKYNTKVYDAIDGLNALGIISDNEAESYCKYLNEANDDYVRERKICELNNLAKSLGYSVTKNEKA